jgi:hypothetical protein
MAPCDDEPYQPAIEERRGDEKSKVRDSEG